jgi:hypothetical protein
MSPITTNDITTMREIPYSNVAGSLMHVMVCTCPNLAYAVHHISQFISSLGKENWATTKCILWYIKTILHLGLCIRPSPNQIFLLVGVIQIGLATLIIENSTPDICFKMSEALFHGN